MLALALAFAGIQPAAAADDGSVLRDSETELLFKQMSKPLIEAAGLDPNSVNVALLNDPEINAFVATGQTVYVQTGLLLAADNVNQLQGVIAHELGHIADGHVVLSDRGTKPAMGMYLLSMVLGLAAMAAGSGEAGAGIMAAGQQAAAAVHQSYRRDLVPVDRRQSLVVWRPERRD